MLCLYRMFSLMSTCSETTMSIKDLRAFGRGSVVCSLKQYRTTTRHRDKTRGADACKNISSFEIKMLAVYGPHSWFWHKAKKHFFDQFWWVFYNKKILTILFIVKYEKITLKWCVFSVTEAHNQQVFGMFKWGKNPKQQRVCALVSMQLGQRVFLPP